MADNTLATDDGLRAACESLRDPADWGAERSEWNRQLAETIDFVRSADEKQRATRAFQERLWERNHVAAVGQGKIRVDRALDDEGFRTWLASRSVAALPASREGQVPFLTSLYEDIKEKLEPFDLAAVPHLKIFRVLTALFPEAMTTVASAGALDKLTRAMGSGRRLDPIERHVWVRERLDIVLGQASSEPLPLAGRITLPWMLYAQFVQAPTEVTEKITPTVDDTKLIPLPAPRRRRGLTAIKGLFPGILSTLEFVRDGVTRPQLLDFLRAASPDAKTSSLAVAVNSLQSEFAVIKADGDRYVLTERGEDVLESQDATHLADWLLTRIIGVDKAIVELRDRGPLPPMDLANAVKAMNPGWTSLFAPQAIVTWLRSMRVIETTSDYKHALTDVGSQWAARIYWAPEALPKEIEPPLAVPDGTDKSVFAEITLPTLPKIVGSIQASGHFPESLIARLHAGIWSHKRRHFAVLTGLSGAGKTLLAREYAKAIVTDPPKQLFTLPVQPGWYDPGALLGYTNPLRADSYVGTKFLEFLIGAVSDPGRPYVVVLDEMNLSHPEQYMAPLLSAMETGDSIQLHAEGDIFDGIPGLLPYPANLVVIGTVNMDETTHGLSDKVLDRSFVLEFWGVDLDAYPRWGERPIARETEARAKQVLGALMAALSPARLHFGWRVVDDVLDFIDRTSDAGTALSSGEALDAVVYAKILPKLRGEDSPRFREALTKCQEALTAFDLEQSRAKVAELRHDLETTGSARFWR